MADCPPFRFSGVKGNAVLLAQKFVGEILHDGCVAVDATMGNGHDTVFMAQKVGPAGKVYAFDIQQAALDATARKLKQSGLAKRAALFLESHASMRNYLKGPADCFIFNLGYLPGGNHGIITQADTTLAALNTALDLLKPGGRISMVVYTGHPGAEEESSAVEETVRRLDPRVYGVLQVMFANRPHWAPFLILIEKAVPDNENPAQYENS
ncbi:MAG: methyltransferase domain-containing protein [Firmicutes bacterium]|nr:methyltransferase domain-containing protein [Bacillota bacterium]